MPNGYSNTSHVNVYPTVPSNIITADKDSNTSHVNVYRNIQIMFPSALKHSNTSHVNVYQCRNTTRKKKLLIQIHLMLMFIGCRGLRAKTSLKDSNTSHVNVYLFQPFSI